MIIYLLEIVQFELYYYVFHRPRNPVFANNSLTECLFTVELLHNLL